MTIIRELSVTDIALLNRLISGYVSHQKYEVSWHDSADTSDFSLRLVHLPDSYVKHFELEEREYYSKIIDAGLSLAAFDDELPVAAALSTVQDWNQSFWIHEFHVMEAYRGRGIGQQLMNAVKAKARSMSCRTIVCETQNTNVPAIRFYRRMGFRIEAVDISLYSNTDFPDGEIALFMKCRLD